jgi:hypothetical protein
VSDREVRAKGAGKQVGPRFTPGPWTVERHDDDDGSINYEIWNHSPEHYTRVVTVNDLNDDGNAKHNARLMSAAPDLFNAIFNSDDAHWTPAMRAAMKKAVGE